MDFEVVEGLFVASDGGEPTGFAGELGLADLEEEGFGGADTGFGEELFAFDGDDEGLIGEVGVAGGFACLEGAIVLGGDVDGEGFAELGEGADVVEDAAFALGEDFGSGEVAGAFEEGLGDGDGESGVANGAEVAGEEFDEVGGEIDGEAGAGALEGGEAEGAGCGEGGFVDEGIDIGLDGSAIESAGADAGEDGGELLADEGEIEGVEVDEFFFAPVDPVVSDGEAEGVGEIDFARAIFDVGTVTEEGFGGEAFFELVEVDGCGGGDREEVGA